MSFEDKIIISFETYKENDRFGLLVRTNKGKFKYSFETEDEREDFIADAMKR